MKKALIGVGFLFITLSAACQNDRFDPYDHLSRQEIESLILDLGHPAFHVRNDRRLRLQQLSPGLKKIMQPYLSHTDRNIRSEVLKILSFGLELDDQELEEKRLSFVAEGLKLLQSKQDKRFHQGLTLLEAWAMPMEIKDLAIHTDFSDYESRRTKQINACLAKITGQYVRGDPLHRKKSWANFFAGPARHLNQASLLSTGLEQSNPQHLIYVLEGLSNLLIRDHHTVLDLHGLIFLIIDRQKGPEAHQVMIPALELLALIRSSTAVKIGILKRGLHEHDNPLVAFAAADTLNRIGHHVPYVVPPALLDAHELKIHSE